VLSSFSLTAANPGELPDMLTRAVERMDRVYQQALDAGKLQPDPTLRIGGTGEIDPAIERLIQIGRAIREQERAQAAAAAAAAAGAAPAAAAPTPQATQAPAVVRSIAVQFATPDAASFDATLAAVRQVGGVRGLAVTSTAMGGTSVMSVSFGGELSELAEALRQRGFAVREGANALAISR
jgi:hypothetical protein